MAWGLEYLSRLRQAEMPRYFLFEREKKPLRRGDKDRGLPNDNGSDEFGEQESFPMTAISEDAQPDDGLTRFREFAGALANHRPPSEIIFMCPDALRTFETELAGKGCEVLFPEAIGVKIGLRYSRSAYAFGAVFLVLGVLTFILAFVAGGEYRALKITTTAFLFLIATGCLASSYFAAIHVVFAPGRICWKRVSPPFRRYACLPVSAIAAVELRERKRSDFQLILRHAEKNAIILSQTALGNGAQARWLGTAICQLTGLPLAEIDVHNKRATHAMMPPA